MIVNLLPMSVFALQHSLIAHKQCRRWWTQFLPKSVERSAGVLFASIALAATVIWHVELVLGAAIASLVGICAPTPRGFASRKLA